MHGLAQICVRRPVFATMLVMALTVVGIFSFMGLGVDLFPDIDFPVVLITVANPGASAEEVEREITERIEGAVNTLSGIDELRSTSAEGMALVVVSFILDKDGDVAAQEVRDKVSQVVGQLPGTAETPVVQKLDPDAQPVLQVVLSSGRGVGDVTTIADDVIREQIENINGVGQVVLVGGRLREIHVRVDPVKLQAYDLTINQVAAALRQQNMELPGGRVDEGARELTVRTMGRLSEAEQFANLVVANRGAYAVRVRDIGEVEDTIEEPRSASYLNGAAAVTLVVSKQSGQNTVAVANEVKDRLNEIAATLPEDFHIEIIGDQSVFIEAAVDSLQSHLIEGSFLAAVVIFIFLMNVRTTLIAAVAIPTSIISTFGLMAAMGYTLNQLTMLALTLMVGIVIDDAIIVLENIYRFIEEKGMSPFQAAIEATGEIGLAVMATTLSLLAVFVPVGFMGGIVGRFMSSFGLTASFAIAVSLLVSFTLTPMLCSRFIRKREGQTAHSKESRFFRPIDRSYTRMLQWAMAHRIIVVAACVAVVVSIVPLFAVVGKNFLPDDDQSAFSVSIRAPEGSTLAATSTVAERVAREIRGLPGVVATLTTIGSGSQDAVNAASVYVKLAPIEERDRPQSSLMADVRTILSRYPSSLRVSVQPVDGFDSGTRNADVQYVITGPEIGQLGEYADRVMEEMKAIPRVVDVDSSLVEGKPELRIQIDRERAADLGVQVADVAQALNTMIAGQVVSTFGAGTRQYDVRLRAMDEFRSDAESLKRITVSSANGSPVTLDKVVRIEESEGPAAIERLNRQRQVTVSGNLQAGGSQAAVIAELDQAVSRMGLAPGYEAGLAGISRELARAAYYFLLAIVLSFLFMYMVLAAQFESFIHPVTILLTLPLAIPFGILSLLVFGQTINIFSGLGMLLLFGIVKKNAILQIDHMNGLREKGIARYEAIIQANRDRLRPILMTTMALIAGMLPLVISSGTGAATNRSIGILVIGGQTLCLLLTLLAVPVFYSLFEDLIETPVWRRFLGRGKALAEEPAAVQLHRNTVGGRVPDA